MKLRIACVVVGFLSLLLSLVPLTVAQTTGETASALPRLVRFGGAVKDLNENPLTGVVGITFALYSEQTGGAALWLETQNVAADSNGHYVALLGSTKPDGLPTELFTSEQARWVGVQVSGQAEQPRVLLVSAPYALKAGDAETIGGLPPSAFVLANGSQTARGAKVASLSASAGAQKNTAPPANPNVTGKGVVDYIPMWNTTSDIVDSIIFQKSSQIGINTKTPAATLDVNGKSDIRNTLTLFPNGTDSTLAISGTAFKIDDTGMMTFIAGQTFPGTGNGTITGVTAGTDLTGGGTSGTVTLNVDTTKIPQLNAANTFTGYQTVNGDLSATGVVTGSSFATGSHLFVFGSYDYGNVFLGFAGNTKTTGVDNTASGSSALANNTTGTFNTASGVAALVSNSTGADNTASGYEALGNNTTASDNTAYGYDALTSNTTGADNTASGSEALYNNNTGVDHTAVGYQALYSNTTGNCCNSAVGYQALYSNTTGNGLTCVGESCTAAAPNLRNATAIGAHAVVGESDALVLGGTGEYAVKVGIGTATPSNVLTIAQGAGHPLSDGWATYSSRRWKTNIQTLHGALEKVVQLRGVSYDLKANGQHEVGVIAEEVGAVVPEVVSYEENGKDARGVDYSRLTALLIEATKEQQREIRSQQVVLRTQVAALRNLKSELRAARQTLEKVKAQVDAAQATMVAAK